MIARLVAALGVSALAGVALGGLMRPSPPRLYAGASARETAAKRAAGVPLPAGGTFNGIRWEDAGSLGSAEIERTLSYNAACQWLRAWRDGRERPRALGMLRAAARWPALRDTAAGEILASVASGDGGRATGMLADCDASHTREVEYAARKGLAPSL